MSEHRATIRWAFAGGDFLKGRYSREHSWTFDGGVTVPASSSPAAVPKPYSNETCVDPEEAFVASLSSCHMLTYLFLASKAGFQIVSYDDDAVGTMTRNDRGIQWVSTVVLQPRIVYGGDKRPSEADEQCFIANSVKTEITVRRSG